MARTLSVHSVIAGGVRSPAPRTSRQILLAGLLVCGLLLAGCGSGAGSPDPEDSLINCRWEVTVGEPLKRIIAVNSAAVENLIALGVEDRIVGATGKRASIRKDLRDEFSGLELFDTGGESYPSAELVLDAEPEFFYSAYRSAFEANGGIQSRDEFETLGIQTYLSPAACPERDYTEPLTFDEFWGELTDLGRLLGVPEAADDVVAEQRAAIEHVRAGLPEIEPLTVFWWDIGTDEPWGGLCCGAPGMIMRELGLVNIFEDVEGDWNDVSWEQVIERGPDMIVMADFGDGDIAEKRRYIAEDETLSRLRAFREGRVVVLPFSQTTPGLQNVDAIRTIGEALRGWEIRE